MTVIPKTKREKLRRISSKREHTAALKEVELLWNARKGSPKEDRLLALVLLIEAYELKHVPIPAPDPKDLARHIREARLE